MAKKIVALYDDFSDAQRVVSELVSSGFDKNQVRLIGSDEASEYSKTIKEMNLKERRPEQESTFSRMWHSLFGTGVSGEDAEHYAEGVRRGGTIVSVETSDDLVDRAVNIMERHHPVDIDQRVSMWRKEGWSGYTKPGAEDVASRTEHLRGSSKASELREGEEVRIPVAEEELAIGKRRVERGGVRVHTFVEQHPVEKDVRLQKEQVRVERHPADRPISEAELERAFKEESFELTESEEEPVVSKRARIVEEVKVKKDVEERVETVRGTERHTKVDVEQMGAERTRSFDTDRAFFETDFNKRFGKMGGRFADYEPAYRYGYTLASDKQYKGRRWEEIEPEVRTRWEAEHKGTWDKFKDAIRHGWNKVT